MLKVENVATPAEANIVVVPDNVPPPGLVPIATVTLAVELVTVLAKASCTVTWTAGVIEVPAIVLLGCVVITNWDAAPGLMLNEALVAPVNPVDDAVNVYPVPVLFMLSVEKVATPLTAETVVVPDSVPPPGLLPMAIVTLAAELVTVFPPKSCTITVGEGEMELPATVVVGCWPKASFAAGPTKMLKALLVVPVNPEAAAVSV